MPIELNHTIVHSKNAKESAQFLSNILGLPEPITFYHFQVVKTDNGVSLDFAEYPGDIKIQHYAFLVSETDFDAILERIKQHNVTYWPNHDRQNPNQINHYDGGRGTYFEDPSGHMLEIITRPYGSGN